MFNCKNRKYESDTPFTGFDYIIIGALISIVGAFLFTMYFVMFKGLNITPTKPQKQCIECHNRKNAMVDYLKRNKVKSPQEMAEALLATRNGRILAALHVRGEKKTPHTAMKTGYKNRYSGAFQTHESWGKITKNTSIAEQALIAEVALTTHVTEEKSIIKGLNAYGGHKDKINGAYAYNVLDELQRFVP